MYVCTPPRSQSTLCTHSSSKAEHDLTKADHRRCVGLGVQTHGPKSESGHAFTGIGHDPQGVVVMVEDTKAQATAGAAAEAS